ncbi:MULTISPECIES: FAD binding domain-containing protein [Amycolatopsis methanolica group]|uniref:Carbon monoxide dehydrogenase medium subunit n=1 Tax=Amycolatopsis methanolica 239 TaxID=1068978 RepID=A0A076MW71_AMYME|nr:xanthine dehydrogenase family protein subunit M [Amycolatopsis methanolica]AIJ21992.1 carbon monoxide dehydrogenase medium subunit [Amycolatopsis methanolica 239]
MQVPAQFQYERATSVAHALSLLTKFGPESRIVAGGHSLIPMMKLRLAQPEALIDINGLSELARISVEDGTLYVGAMVRHADLLSSAVVGEHFPIFHDAERLIADPVVRNRGTVGGSLCQADPSEDLSAAFAAVRGEAVIEGTGGRRVVLVREFFTGPYQTVVGENEMLVQLRVPISSSASAYEKVERRAGDWAVAAVGAELRIEGTQLVSVGIGLTALGAPNFHAPEAEEYLLGGPAVDERFAEAGRIAARHCEPVADQRGPVDYKRHLAEVLTVRALRRARTRWHGNHPQEA